MSLKQELNLAGCRSGRVVLHTIGLIHDGRVKWHIDGIMRELKRK